PASSAPPSRPEPPPWDEEPSPPREAAREHPAAAAQKKTELTADDAVATVEAPPAVVEPPPPPRTKALPPTPVPSLNWDGDWPTLAAALPLRGVVQQLAQQSELLQCEATENVVQIKLRIPLDTLRSAGSVEKLEQALGNHFGKTVRVDTEIGAVEQTANAAAMAEREARQREAEQNINSDPFVQSLMREFGATIVPGSIKPA
ncbi:DNA polymerase III subunit gamma/tau, partial [Oxalobacteraceae bacterium OM1]